VLKNFETGRYVGAQVKTDVNPSYECLFTITCETGGQCSPDADQSGA